MGKCVGAPHPNTFPYTSSIPLPTSFPHTPTHFLSPYTFSHPYPLSPFTLPHFSTSHTSFLNLPPHPNTFPTPLPIAPLTSPYTPTHFPTNPMHSPHSFDYVGKLPCDHVNPNKFNWKSPIKFFTTTGNLKSCFGVANVNFRCMKVWRSYHVAKLLWRSHHVAKLLATVSGSANHNFRASVTGISGEINASFKIISVWF